jgi:SAM-dependent methyltransferase
LNNDWYEHSFGEDYLIVYRHRDSAQAQREVEAMMGWMELPPGASVLDVGCGMGRHAMALRDLGYAVTGLDLSEVLLAHARRNDPGRSIRWVRGDMRKLPFEDKSFDAVVNWFTSFGYFFEDEENARVLAEIGRVLAPGGKFLIDFLNAAYVERHLVPLSERTDGPTGLRIREERFIRNGYVVKKIAVSSPDGDVRNYEERVRLFGLESFRKMAAEAGLVLESVRGGYDGSPYDPDQSPRLIMTGRRPA